MSGLLGTSLDSTAIDALLIVFILFYLIWTFESNFWILEADSFFLIETKFFLIRINFS